MRKDREDRMLSVSDEKRMELRGLVKALRSSGGVGHGVSGIETFLLMPDDFRRGYDRLVERALKPAVGDGGGRAAEASAALGRAVVKGSLKGTEKGLGQAGGGGKRWKVFWTVRDERALELKSKVDKKLRVLAREIARAEAEWDGGGSAGEGAVRARQGGGEPRIESRCSGCGRAVDAGWSFCPNDGEDLR